MKGFHKRPCFRFDQLRGWLAGLFCAVLCGHASAAEITADAESGNIVVETSRYTARFEGGTLVYLFNKLKNQAMIDAGLTPDIPITQRTALYVADKSGVEPYWIAPVLEGEDASTVAVRDLPDGGVAVTFRGLATLPGLARRTFPDAELTIEVRVGDEREDLLVKTTGRSPSTQVAGSCFAYSGLPMKTYRYLVSQSGLKTEINLEGNGKNRHSVFEWSNMHMEGARLGLKGGLWPAAVTVQSLVEDPKASFSIWAEDDVPRQKFLIESGKGQAYVSYEMPPYATNHEAESVVWHVNVFDGGWSAAATPFARSLKERGYADNRASWREDISLMIFVPGPPSEAVLNSLKATFPPEVRPRILLWMPQAWRAMSGTQGAKTHDAYYWDNSFSEEAAASIRATTEAGFRISGYTNPHYAWGATDQVIDPEVREAVRGFKQYPFSDPFTGEALKGSTIPHSLAYTLYREHMLATYKNVFENLDMSLYMDTTHQIMFDGRGREVDGMTSYDGALAFFRGSRALKQEQFIGMEFLTELGVMGLVGDYGLFMDLGWSKGWEDAKAVHSHPIVSFLFGETSLQVAHIVDPWSYPSPRYYHMTEEISECLGTIATGSWWWGHSPQGAQATADTPEKRHWLEKVRIFTTRGLRPFFPEQWDEEVMSYLRAKDGAVFKFIETDYGSKLIEELPSGETKTHLARAWKTPTAPAHAGQIPDWIGIADNGEAIGLDHLARRGYVLFPDSDGTVAARFRLNSLPEGLAIIDAEMGKDLALLEVGPRERGEKPAGDIKFASAPRTADLPPNPVSGSIGVVSEKPLVRVVSRHQPAPQLRDLGQKDGKYHYELKGEFWGEQAFLWTEGVVAPFEMSDDFVLPTPAGIPSDSLVQFLELQPFDQAWNAPVNGARNPRPGSVYHAQVETTAAGPGDKSTFVFQLTYKSMGTGLFQGTGPQPLDQGEQTLSFAGIRTTVQEKSAVKELMVRTYVQPPDPNVTGAVRSLKLRFVRPQLGVSDMAPIDLGTVQRGESAVSSEREIFNSQKITVTANDVTYETLLHGAANLRTPDEKRPDLQENDFTGIVLVSGDAEKFSLEGGSPGAQGGIKLVRENGEPGLRGGPDPDRLKFAVRFDGASESGTYQTTVRIVTQAANTGNLSTGAEGEPAKDLYYTDIPIKITVNP